MLEHLPGESPAIEECVLAARGGRSVHELWRRLELSGGPIIEPCPRDAAECLVTFGLRARPETRRVRVAGPGGLQRAAQHQLQRVGDTDLFYRTYRMDRRLRTSYWFVAEGEGCGGSGDTGEMPSGSTRFPDPFNPAPSDGSPFPPASVLSLPDAPAQPWLERRTDLRGNCERVSIESHALSQRRTVRIYTPPGYCGETSHCDLVVVLDGECYVSIVPGPTILDNLIGAGAIRPCIAAFVDNVDVPTRLRELACNDRFSHFLARELLPWLEAQYRVTPDTMRRVLCGSSFGGLAATFGALRHPDAFGAVLSQSTPYCWSPGFDPSRAPSDQGHLTPDWLVHQVDRAEPFNTRLYLEAGLFEGPPGVSPVVGSRRLVETLRRKGVPPVAHSEYVGGHDYYCWRGSFADGLIALLG